MQKTLQEIVEDRSAFSIGAELVTTRGLLMEIEGMEVLALARELGEDPRFSFVNITDNPGGNPMVMADTLGTDLVSRGQNVIIHLTAKDSNRNFIESRAWKLASMGMSNILAMSGDYPVSGYRGQARPVFDLDSVAILQLLSEMNKGLLVKKRGKKDPVALKTTGFTLGAVVSPFKRYENEQIPQYFKLERKLRAGAQFIITQLGYDSRKFHELLCYLQWRNIDIPVYANIYMLSLPVARAFNKRKIPGCFVSDRLLELAEEAGKGPDKGKTFFIELAAKQVAVAKGLGYAGAYLGGTHKHEDFSAILEMAERFSPDDWKTFAREIQFSEADTFYLFERDPETGLNVPYRLNREYAFSITPEGRRLARAKAPILYALNRFIHASFFEPGTSGFRSAQKFYSWFDKQTGKIQDATHRLEYITKATFYDCHDCGDCSLPDIAYLCPESQCAKNQRNGPCGGTHDSLCEVEEVRQCIWARAYDRFKAYGEEEAMMRDHEPIFTDGALRYTSGWRNYFLGRDHSQVKPE